MKKGFYPKLAADGIRKNKRLYLPFILTCIGMVAMEYIITFLGLSKAILQLPGGETIRVMMRLGSLVIAIFAVIFLFYTNSFLLRRRKKEFGLFNILGMGKNNIAVILLWECLIILGISLVCGLFFGIALSKLAEIGLFFIMNGSADYSFSIDFSGVLMTVGIFALIFVLLYFNALIRVKHSSAVDLIKSENSGEKAPKANWLLGVLGVIFLGAAYYLAVSIDNPIEALVWFFVAVVMVIVATYLLMISGSVLFCRLLQKNKDYYYRSNHFVSVSSMVYRMKRNGAGLASICVLATMVLVMISSSSSLYFGAEDSLTSRYPREICVTATVEEPEQLDESNISIIRDYLNKNSVEFGAKPSNINQAPYAYVSALPVGTDMVCDHDSSKIGNYSYDSIRDIWFFDVDFYNEDTGDNLQLAPGEVMLLTYRCSYDENVISFNDGKNFSVRESKEGRLHVIGEQEANMVPSITVILPKLSDIESSFPETEKKLIGYKWIYEFDTGIDNESQIKLTEELIDRFADNIDGNAKYKSVSIESRAEDADDFYGSYGGLFYLGILLSLVFTFAAVLIIYYKQISEGYEDQSRFEIMQKVGMTKHEIRRSINSQLLTVFFLPLAFAGMHLAFAFPIIRRLLTLFALHNVMLFVLTTLISFAAFALLYTLIYRITSNAYYNIVSGAKSDD